MKTKDIRTKFLEFFKSKKHTIIKSDSLVPKNDPTVLFTTAGMQQFKRQFLGAIDGYTRAATSQKCLRTDDLDEVGRTDFHHTFFEMLGNFSFGDYFKSEAIAWAWEFLTKELQIPENRLWVSVYKEDSEAKKIWLNDIKINPKKLFELGDKSNFWPSNARLNGPNGPCGPCSEIFYDYEPDKGTFPTDPDNEPGRFCEVWNLVFTQFNRKDGGELEPLPNKNIDTGMGLERLSAVMQGVKNNFDTDIFVPILKLITKNIPSASLTDQRIMADHIRAIVFGINDGVPPSNEGRGYVMKKLIIDITDKALRAGMKDPVIYTLVPGVVEAMSDQYPEIKTTANDIAQIIRNIENAYIKVRTERLPEFCQQIKGISSGKALGEIIFKFRDTYGLALETIVTEIRQEKNMITVNLLEEGLSVYQKLMADQQTRSRAASKMTGDVFSGETLDLSVPKTQFLGYTQSESTSSLLKIFINGERVTSASAGDHVKIILDKTPFYAESGGQVGDTGWIKHEDNQIRVVDTQKMDDIFVHTGEVVKGQFKTDDVVTASIDLERRMSIMRNHTATHLLQAALRRTLGTHVQQQGSLVEEDRLRFDFTHHQAISAAEIQKIEEDVNRWIRNCDTITTEYLGIEDAQKSGALAFFAEKYGKEVRVVSIAYYSKEFCGGTHLTATGQIGIFKIINESAIAQGIRRLEAKTGSGALKGIQEQEQYIMDAAKTMKTAPADLIDRIKQQSERLKKIEKEFDELKFEVIKTAISAGLNETEKAGSLHIYSKSFTNIEMNTLRKISEFIKQKIPSSIIILGAKSETDAAVLISSSDAAIKQGFKADELIQEIAEKINGRGGGRPQMAQAGGKNTAKVDEAIQELSSALKNRLN